MSDLMTFPETWEEFERSYGFVDKDEVYTNGARLIPSFRVEQWIEHIQTQTAEPTLYGYPIEHLEMIARVMAKEHCTPEDVVRMLQNAGEIAIMVRDEMLERIKESVERSCKGEANEDCN